MMQRNTYLKTLTFALLALLQPVAGNELFCVGLGLAANLIAPTIRSMLYGQMKKDMNFELPLNAGKLALNEPTDEMEFDGCAFSMPMNMGLDTKFLNIKDAASFNVEGVLQPSALWGGQVCMENVTVVDYGIDSMDLDWLDTLFGGSLPGLNVQDEICVSLMEALQLGVNATIAAYGNGNNAQLRGAK